MFAIVGLPTLLSVMSFALFFFYVFYGQRIQSFAVLRGITRSLARLETMRGEARGVVVDYLSQLRKAHAEASGGTGAGRGGGDDSVAVVQQRIDGIIDYVTIPPVDIDPGGIVQKIEHLSSTSDERVRREIARLMGGSADPVSLSIAQNLVEIAGGLNSMYKVVRHQYLSGRKTNSYATLAQLQMSLPHIMEQAEGLARAADSIKEIKPLGDGAGPLVASKFIDAGASIEKIAKDTVLARIGHKGRRLIVIKAEGPMAYVGKPGIAIMKVVEGMETPPKAIILVDAGAKLEGEETGGVAQGIGAAIGGVGVEKFQIEEVAAKYRIPLYAVLIKEGEEDVMTTMKEEIAEGAAKAAEVVERIIEETTHEGDCVILAGIGNTLGIGQ
jgi:hypothetical protein